MYKAIRFFTMLLALFTTAGCSSVLSSPGDGNAVTPSHTAEEQRASPTQPSIPTVAIQPTEEPTVITIPNGDPRVAGQRELLFARLDLDGAGAELRPAEPVMPAEELGFVEVWAFELSDPYVHFSFYLYEDGNHAMAVFERFLAEDSELRAWLPEGVEDAGGPSSGNFPIAYYYPDGSRGDPKEAERAMYEVLQRTAGDE